MVQRPALLTASRPISIEARDAALMQLRISDRAALYAHPLPTEGGICPQQLLIALAVDHVLPRIPGLRDLTLADYRAVLHYNSWSACCAWTIEAVTIVARRGTPTARLSAVLMIMTLVLLG